MKTITLNSNTVLTFVESHCGVDIWHGTNSWKQTGYWYVPKRLGQRGAYEMRNSIEAIRALIEHDSEVDCLPRGVPGTPAIGTRFVVFCNGYATIMTIELVRENIVVARSENGGQRIYVDGDDYGAVGGRLVSAETFLQGFVDQEAAWIGANISAARDALISGVAPLVL